MQDLSHLSLDVPNVDETSIDRFAILPEHGWVRRRIQRFRRRFNPPRRLIPTRPGVFALLTPIVLGAAALNANNNLLFILVGISLSLIALSGFLSERNISGLFAQVEAAGPVFVGEPARLVVTVERADWARQSKRYGIGVKESAPVRDKRSLARPLRVDIPLIEGRKARALTERTFDRRGLKRLGTCEMTTSYPFGLFRKNRDLDLDAAIMVRPKRVEVPPQLADPRGVAADGTSTQERGVGVDVYGLREWTESDPAHRVHALRSMRFGRDLVIETEAMARPVAWIGVVNDAGAEPKAFEASLEIAQATLQSWSEQGYAVGLETLGRSFPPGAADLDDLLDVLADLGPEDPTDEPRTERCLWLVPSGAKVRPEKMASVDSEGQLDLHLEGANLL